MHSQSILMHPNETFSVFEPNGEKLNHIANWLMNDSVPNVEDWERDYIHVWYNIIPRFTNRQDLHIYYEIKDFSGLLGFTSIVHGHKCFVPMKIWNPEAWKPQFIRDGKEVVQLIMEEYNLRRMNARTADERMVKFASKFGFKVDGVKKGDFKYKGNYIDSYSMSLEVENGT